MTEYEERLLRPWRQGARCHAVKAARPFTNEQTAELSLFEYLPDDLDSLDYVPYGMEGYVFNMRNRRAKEQGRVS